MKIKRYVREKASSLFVENKEILCEEIENADVISFDIFDTLIGRACITPEKIFEIVQKKYFQVEKNRSTNYIKDRIKAEKRARRESKFEEIKLAEIMDCMPSKYKPDIILLHNLEIITELENCYAKKDIQKYYLYANKINKHIVLSSDMYLPQEIIEKMLTKCGYTNYERIYLSSVYRKRKGTGHLFDELLGTFPLGENRILHIGDNLLSDYFAPKRKGIKTFLINS